MVHVVLELEVLETSALEDVHHVSKTMSDCMEQGVKFAFDDFGTGYSSLSYLHRFPMDVLKIDRSFIENVHEKGNHQAIIKTIIDLAASLNMVTIGEGIENAADAKLLTQMGCIYGQGYHFYKPLPGGDIEAFYLVKAKKHLIKAANSCLKKDKKIY